MGSVYLMTSTLKYTPKAIYDLLAEQGVRKATISKVGRMNSWSFGVTLHRPSKTGSAPDGAVLELIGRAPTFGRADGDRQEERAREVLSNAGYTVTTDGEGSWRRTWIVRGA